MRILAAKEVGEGLGMGDQRRLPHLPDHRLETVARHLLVPLSAETRLHRALDDARLTALVWMAMGGKSP
jgi:DNA polymerase-3 subunit epsilon